MKHSLITIILLFSLISCASNKTSLPVVSRFHSVHSASQQKVVSEATDQAISQLDLPKLDEKRISCRLSAVMPHSKEELNNYIMMKVEGKLSEKGAIMLRDAEDSALDYICQITVGVSGADIQVVKEVASGKRIAANVFLQFPTLFTSWVWYPIIIKTRNYVGQSKLAVELLPQKPGNSYVSASGEGSFVMAFDGEDVDHYPLIEGSAYQKNNERKVDYTTKSSKKVKKSPESP